MCHVLVLAGRAKWTNFGQAPASAGGQPALSAIDKYAQRMCADQIAAFRPAVAAADPRGVFRNDWLTALFEL